MKDGNLVVTAIGLIAIVGIAALIVNGSNECASQTMTAVNSANALLLQQKDFEIKKLVNRLDAKQKESNDAKAMLESVTKTDPGTTAEKPSAQ